MASVEAATAPAYPRDPAESYVLAALIGLGCGGWAFVAWQARSNRERVGRVAIGTIIVGLTNLYSKLDVRFEVGEAISRLRDH